MAKRRLTGKRYFEAQGRSAASMGLSLSARRAARSNWPVWAQEAYTAGWMLQRPIGV